MKTACLVLAATMLSSAAMAQDKSYTVAKWVFLSATAADVASTFALPDGYQEGNPVLGKHPAQIIGVSVGFSWLVLRAEKRAHNLYKYNLKLAEEAAASGDLKSAYEYGQVAADCKHWSKVGFWLGSAFHIGAASLNFSRHFDRR